MADRLSELIAEALAIEGDNYIVRSSGTSSGTGVVVTASLNDALIALAAALAPHVVVKADHQNEAYRWRVAADVLRKHAAECEELFRLSTEEQL